MRPLLNIAFFLILIAPIARAQKKSPVLFPPPILGMNAPEFINACDLTDHVHQLVYTRFIYSGVEEYWSLRSDNKNCTQINAYLELPDSIVVQSEYLKLLKNVHTQYWKSYLIIDAIGVFDNSNKLGYGHLGSNNSKFTINRIVNIQKVETKK